VRNDIDLKYFNNRLKERLQEITEGQARQKKETAPIELDQSKVGRLSRMDAMQQQAMSQAAARLVEFERQRIQAALGLMKAGDYGYCTICGEDIAEKRLRFDPSLLTCIDCARAADGKGA
jgi:RNA polymerase-binding transcription factor